MLTENEMGKARNLTERLLNLPADFFSLLRELLPQEGCFNQCQFCSQNAPAHIYQITDHGLEILFNALKMASGYVLENHPSQGDKFTEKNGEILGKGRRFKKDLMYPYLSNDIFQYEHLESYLKLGHETLGLRFAVSTVGYSRTNMPLQQMHERINRNLKGSIGRLRFSVTPYTLAVARRGRHVEKTSQLEYYLDLANTMKTYRDTISGLGYGKYRSCVELRFNPSMHKANVRYLKFKEHHVILSGPLAVITDSDPAELRTTRISRIENRHPVLDGELVPSKLIISDLLRKTEVGEIKRILDSALGYDYSASEARILTSDFCMLMNVDGPYFCFSPTKNATGHYSKYIYPSTNSGFVFDHDISRSSSGYMDSERYFMNTLIEYEDGKFHQGSGVGGMKWFHVYEAISSLLRKANELSGIDYFASKHIRESILPLVNGYAFSLRESGMPPDLFFNKNFTVDTGDICNIGRAFSEYRGIASRTNIPVSLNQEKAFGYVSNLSDEGQVWRIRPYVDMMNADGKFLKIEKIDLSRKPDDVIDAPVLYEETIPFEEIEVISLTSRSLGVVPGYLRSAEQNVSHEFQKPHSLQ